MTGLLNGLANAAIRFRWFILAGWAVVLVLAAIGASQAEHALKVGGFSLPGTEFNTTSEILSEELELSSDKAALLVFHSDQYVVTDEVFYLAVDNALTQLAGQPEVSKVESFYTTGIPDMVSPDNHTTYAWVTLQGEESHLEEVTPHLRELVRSDDVDVYLIGQAAANYDIEIASADDLVRVERLALPLVFILLVLVFGSLIAAGVPVVLGIVCVSVSLAVLYLLAQITDVSIFALNTATMIGLGLAIDFSLILISRYREELLSHDRDEALRRTMQTAGRSITFSGITLMLTMSVLTLFPVMVIRSIALSIAVVAGVAVLSGLLLLPSILAVLGPWVNRADLRRYIPGLNRPRSGMSFWERWVRGVMRRPWVSLVIAFGILLVMALPAINLERRGVTVEVLPEGAESREAYELVQRQFGLGEAAPLFVVIKTAPGEQIWQPELMEGLLALHQQLESDPRVAGIQSLATLVPNPSPEWIRSLSPATLSGNPDRLRLAERLANIDGDNTTTVLVVYPRNGETDEETVALMLDVREHAQEWAPQLADVAVLVGGSPAQHYDFDKVVYDQFPLLLGLSLLVTFVILMIFFHSIVLPIKAIVLNLIGLAATYGLLVLVFQYGVGDSLLGFESLGAVLSYTPVLLFSILFGLSTDYEVFMLSRVREYVREGYSNEDSVAYGLDRTAGVITAAGLIMIVVFGSFAFTGVLVIKEIGFALAVAVLLDMTLVRMVLVPASMKLMERANWWMPKTLGRFIPEIDEGGPAAPHQTPAPVSGGE